MLALAWALALIIVAILVPVYSTQGAFAPSGRTVALPAQTFVQVNGAYGVTAVVLPALLAAIAYASLHRKCARGGSMSGYVAWTCIALLVAFCVVTSPTIGLFVLPVAVFLWLSARRTPAAATQDDQPTDA